MKKLHTLYIIIGGIVLLTGALLMLFRMEPLTDAARESYSRMAGLTRETAEYHEIRPEGLVRGGIVIYPDSGEDPISYVPLAERLAEQGLATRLVKYPLGRAALSKTERRELDNASGISWITLGFGQGREKSCILADRSEEITGLILIGECRADVNLTDNDIRVSFFDLEDEPVPEESMARIMKRLPADTLYLTASSTEEILGQIPGEAAISALRNRQGDDESSLVAQINRILARSVTNRNVR